MTYSKDDELYIVTGDPSSGPASSTRFILPFAYKKRPSQPHDDRKAHWARLARTAEFVFERRYLNFDSALVLYDRTCWMELRSGQSPAPATRFKIWRQPDSLDAGSSERAIEVQAQTPRLVLFEWPAPTEERGRPDAFRTGFLILELSFPEEGVTLGDLLYVNERFRCWLQPFAEHVAEKGYAECMREVPGYLEPWPGTGVEPSGDPYLGRWASLLKIGCKVDGEWFHVVEPADTSTRDWAEVGGAESGWAVTSDARTFVWTCAVLPQGAAALRAVEGGIPIESGSWIRLLNVDAPGDSDASVFERSWARDRTYRRWAEGSALYGFTVHSGAAVLPPWTGLPLWKHYGEVYFDQTLLLLYSRLSLFRFSRWLTEASGKARDGQSHSRRGEYDELVAVRRGLTFFANLYQYPLLSNQQQGLEMYTLSREVMDVSELADELRRQIEGTHELLDMLAARDEARAARRLNVLAAVGLVLALATGFLGMNVISEGMRIGVFNAQGVKEWGIFAMVTGAVLVIMLSVARYWRPIERWIFGKSRG